MSELVDPTKIESIVGVDRHDTAHWGRAVSAEQAVYILHSQQCVDFYDDLRECEYSQALTDHGIDLDTWVEDQAVLLTINRRGRLSISDGES